MLPLVLMAISNMTFAEVRVPVEKPIMKIVTPSGKVIYTDRSLPNISTEKAQFLRGAVTDHVLAQTSESKAIDAVKNEAAKNTAGKSEPVALPPPAGTGGLVDWAKQQEILAKQQSEQLKESQTAMKKVVCDQAKASKLSLQAPRPGRVNDKGEIIPFSDLEIADKKAQAEKLISENCV